MAEENLTDDRIDLFERCDSALVDPVKESFHHAWISSSQVSRGWHWQYAAAHHLIIKLAINPL